MTPPPVLSVQGLTVGYRRGDNVARPVVHDVSFDVGPGQVLALVGESGSGKTTTGHALLGLLPANGEVLAGLITFRGQDLTRLGPREWSRIRGVSLGLIPQDPTISLDPVRRVGHQIEDVLRLHTDLDDDARRERVYELCRLVGFADVERLYRQYPHELSGGMRQRVLVAAAVAGGPDLIVADEPTSGLDATVQKQVLDLIDDLRKRSSASVVLVTHDLGVAADRSDVIGVMRQGRILEFGPTADVIADPQHPYTRRLLDSVPRKALPKSKSGSREPTNDSGIAIEVTDLSKHYGDVPAIDGISFKIRRGQTFALVGESGSGKSTTARVLTGVTPATSGRVEVLGSDITHISRRAYRPLRRRIQVVYQNPYSSFDPRFDVFDVVEEPLRAFQPAALLPGSARRQRQANADRVAAALEAAALPADFATRHPRELSGGQRQRVAIARALVVEPEVVVLDEPTSALDVSVAAQILELLQRLQAERGLTYVFISHDLAVVSAISDHVAVMRQGRIIEQGPTDTVFGSPRQPYTSALLDAIAGRDLAAAIPGGSGSSTVGETMTTSQPDTLDEAFVRIRSVLGELAKGAAERDRIHEHPYALVQELADAGFGRLRLNREFGGFDVDLPTLFSLLAEAGQADSNIPQIWRGHFTTTEILRREHDADARRHWSEKIAAGAVFGNAQSEPSSVVAGLESVGEFGPITTRVRVDGRGRRTVSGTKFYSTGSRFADYIRAAVVDDDGRRGFVVIPARLNGVEHIDDWDGVGQRQTGSGTTVLTDVPVEPHGDLGRAVDTLQGLDSFVQIVHLANLTGIARSIVADTVDIVRARTRTSRHALTQNAAADPDVLAVVGRLRARSLIAETLLDRAARSLEGAHSAGVEESYADAYIETSTAQVAVIEAVLGAATEAFDAGGSSTVRVGVHLDRHWRNARTLASHNPVIYKPRVIGDFLVNGNRPVSGYYAGRESKEGAS